MTTFLAVYFVLQIPFKAFLYRARGQSWGWSTTQLNRFLFWAFPYAIDGEIIAYLLGLGGHGIINICGASFFAAFIASVVGHGKWQGPGSLYNCAIMGLITTGMLTIMLLPFLYYDISLIGFAPLGMLGFIASWLGYHAPWVNSTLRLFGVTWCRPVAIGGSEWEEFGIGVLPFGVTICLIGYFLMGII